MRNGSLARVTFTALGACAVMTAGCGTSPSGPAGAQSFSVLSISPTEGPGNGSARAVIAGTGFQRGVTVAVDGNRVDATVLNSNALSIPMPAHAAGKVAVTVTDPRSQAQASVPGGYTYVDIPTPPGPPPVISQLLPNSGSTAGGAPIRVIGNGTGSVWSVVTAAVDGIVIPAESAWPEDATYLSMPAHAAGAVEVIVTDRHGQTANAIFTYASPSTFDFNGEWQGWAVDLALPPGVSEWALLRFTVRDNLLVSVSCLVCRPGENCGTASAASLPLDPPPVIVNGEFSFAGSGVSVNGRILSPISTSGSINTPSCGHRQWNAEKR